MSSAQNGHCRISLTAGVGRGFSFEKANCPTHRPARLDQDVFCVATQLQSRLRILCVRVRAMLGSVSPPTGGLRKPAVTPITSPIVPSQGLVFGLCALSADLNAFQR
jgi:hypothetical protein